MQRARSFVFPIKLAPVCLGDGRLGVEEPEETEEVEGVEGTAASMS